MDRALARGIELEVETGFGDMRARASYGLQRATQEPSGTALQNSPRHVAKLHASGPIGVAGAIGGVELLAVSDRMNAKEAMTAGYAIMNLTINVPTGVRGMTANATMYNALNSSYGDPTSAGAATAHDSATRSVVPDRSGVEQRAQVAAAFVIQHWKWWTSRRRVSVTTLFAAVLCILLMPSTIRAQADRGRTPLRMVVLQGSATAASNELLTGLRQRFKDLGVRAELVVMETETPGVSTAAERAKSSAVDLVLALGVRAAAIAATEFPAVPTIRALVSRESVLPAGRSVVNIELEFALEHELEWLHRILPKARRVGVLYSTDDNAKAVVRAREIANSLGLEIVARRIANPSEIPAALSALSGSVDVLWGISDELVLIPETARAVLVASLRNRVPFVGLSSSWVRAGAIYALDRDYADMGAQTADLSLKLIDGSARGSTVVRPRKILYSLNARSATLLGVVLPREVVSGAVEVVK